MPKTISNLKETKNSRGLEIIEDDAKQICQSLSVADFENKTILLTGASGLLGLYFLATVRHLNLHKKANIKLFSVVFSEPDAVLKYLANFPGSEFLRGDIADNIFTTNLPTADMIIHAAGYGQPGKFTANPVKTLELNLMGTFGLIRRLNSGGKFLFTSSAEVYTGLTPPPFTEAQVGTTNTTHPRSCYIEGKRGGEAICNAFRTQGIDAKSARISMTYGPGTRAGDLRVMNMLIQKGLQGRIDLMDDGSAQRTFLYVADAILMMWNILLHGKYPIYNVGGSYSISIYELAQSIGQKLDAPVFKASTTGMPGAPVNVKLDMSQYESEFGLLSTEKLISFELGLEKTIQWQRGLYE